MAQLHLYLPREVAEEIERRAEASGQSTSRYLATLVMREMGPGWPESWFDRVVGRWAGPLEREPTGRAEDRERW